MQAPSAFSCLPELCGDAGPFAARRDGRGQLRTRDAVLWLVAGSAAYGAAMGAWSSYELALYAAIKLPLLLFATAGVNALANGVVARAAGYRLSLGAALRVVIASFSLVGIVLGSLAPVVLLFDRTVPGPWSPAAWRSHDLLGALHVAAIAIAGTAAVVRQRRWLADFAPRGEPGALAFAWLALNLFVGAQLAWNLRPWFGSPGLTSEFLREHPFDGTFYESVFRLVAQSTFDPK
ncbi:MAG: hypothetical protein IT453_10825 [Planctomycetes bacterium]|nr:hypothetical protein [Planctomycetota bacterium]